MNLHSHDSVNQTALAQALLSELTNQSVIANQHELFKLLYESADCALMFKPSWHNGTGYFDPLAASQEVGQLIEMGTFAKTSDEAGRKIVVGNTPAGLVVFFERYADDFTPVCSHMPRGVAAALNCEHRNKPTLTEMRNIIFFVEACKNL